MKTWNKDSSKKFLSPTLSRKHILIKPVLKIVGSLTRKRLLEFGCGNGFWLRHFSKAGALCTGVDISKEQIELAKVSLPEATYFIHDAATFVSKRKFNVIFVDHVLSETSSRKKILAILRNAHNLLTRDGVLVINEMHPSVAHFSFEHTTPDADYFYFKSGTGISFDVKQADGNFIDIHDYHWTLGDLSLFLKEADFLIDEIVEPQASKGSNDPYVALRYRAPSHVLIKARPR